MIQAAIVLTILFSSFNLFHVCEGDGYYFKLDRKVPPKYYLYPKIEIKAAPCDKAKEFQPMKYIWSSIQKKIKSIENLGKELFNLNKTPRQPKRVRHFEPYDMRFAEKIIIPMRHHYKFKPHFEKEKHYKEDEIISSEELVSIKRPYKIKPHVDKETHYKEDEIMGTEELEKLSEQYKIKENDEKPTHKEDEVIGNSEQDFEFYYVKPHKTDDSGVRPIEEHIEGDLSYDFRTKTHSISS